MIISTLVNKQHNTKPRTLIILVYKLTFYNTINIRKKVKYFYLCHYTIVIINRSLLKIECLNRQFLH